MNLLQKGFTSAALSAAGLFGVASDGLAQTAGTGTATTAGAGSTGTTSTSTATGASTGGIGTPTRFGTGFRTATGARFRPGSRSTTAVTAPSDGSRFDGDLSQLRGDDSQLRGDVQSSNNNGNVQSARRSVRATSADDFSPPDGLSASPGAGAGLGERSGARGGFSPNELGPGGFAPNRIGRGGFAPNEFGPGGFDPDGSDGPARTDIRIRRSTLFGRTGDPSQNQLPGHGSDGRSTASGDGGFRAGDRADTFGGRSPSPQADVPRADVFGQGEGAAGDTGGSGTSLFGNRLQQD